MGVHVLPWYPNVQLYISYSVFGIQHTTEPRHICLEYVDKFHKDEGPVTYFFNLL